MTRFITEHFFYHAMVIRGRRTGKEEEEERVDHVFPLLTSLCGMYTPGSV